MRLSVLLPLALAAMTFAQSFTHDEDESSLSRRTDKKHSTSDDEAIPEFTHGRPRKNIKGPWIAKSKTGKKVESESKEHAAATTTPSQKPDPTTGTESSTSTQTNKARELSAYEELVELVVRDIGADAFMDVAVRAVTKGGRKGHGHHGHRKGKGRGRGKGKGRNGKGRKHRHGKGRKGRKGRKGGEKTGKVAVQTSPATSAASGLDAQAPAAL